MNRKRALCALAGVCLPVIAFAAPAMAQTADQPPPAGNPFARNDLVSDIVVTARRKGELSQDVPLVVQAVTSEKLDRLNIRRIQDITTLVPGLSMTSNINGIGTQSSLRGVNYDGNASGNNGTIEFYLNDASISSQVLFQSSYDISQIEVLRGPQGTLRGRASPSGSITVTTRRPDMSEFGGYINATGTTVGQINLNGAINLPIVKDVLAVRVAGLFDDSEGNRVQSVTAPGVEPYFRSRAFRATARFDPTDSLSFVATYQRQDIHSLLFDQRESANVADASLAASPTPIAASDRLGVTDVARPGRQLYDVYNGQSDWRFAGQKLSYVGAYTHGRTHGYEPLDPGNVFGSAFPAIYQTPARITDSTIKQQSHELRLASEEKLFGVADYVIGALIGKLDAPTELTSDTAFFAVTRAVVQPGDGLPTVCLSATTCSGIIVTPVQRRNATRERSVFGNLTIDLGRTELSGGLRYIHYEATASLRTNGNLVAAANEDRSHGTVIYSASAKHRFNSSVMAYASLGTSWRPGISATGDFSLARGDLENQFLILPPESSKSYEVGVKTNWIEDRLTLNLTAFHQTFENYPFRIPAAGVFYVSTDLNTRNNTLVKSVKAFNFIGAVPVTVNGVELEAAFMPSRDLSVSGSVAYSLGKLKNGVIPCNDYFPHDGVPDSTSTVPTVAQIEATAPRSANGTSGTITSCSVSSRSSFAAPLSGNLQAEYGRPMFGEKIGFVRGLATWYGRSQNDPSNALDDVKAYSLLNLYAGVRDPAGAWEMSLYARNITNTERVLSRSRAPLTTAYATALGGQASVSTYRDINYTAPREFGINLRHAFGSR